MHFIKFFFCLIVCFYANKISSMPVHDTISAKKMNVYFISGLGADQRVFKKLEIDKRFNVEHIKWVEPKRGESLKNYCKKLLNQIDTTQPFQLVGLSFGGMIATEMSEICKPEQIILISSNSIGVPLAKFWIGFVDFILLSPYAGPFLKKANKTTYKFFGAKTKEEKALLRSILKDTDTKFLKWALVRISRWNHPKRSPIAYEINGTEDKMIKPAFVKADKWIEGGEHLMVYSKADVISPILNEQLLKKFK